MCEIAAYATTVVAGHLEGICIYYSSRPRSGADSAGIVSHHVSRGNAGGESLRVAVLESQNIFVACGSKEMQHDCLIRIHGGEREEAKLLHPRAETR